MDSGFGACHFFFDHTSTVRDGICKKVYTHVFAFLSRVRSGNLAIAVKSKLE